MIAMLTALAFFDGNDQEYEADKKKRLHRITSDLVAVNQRLISPYFGDLAEWLCNALWRPSQMASSCTSGSGISRLPANFEFLRP